MFVFFHHSALKSLPRHFGLVKVDDHVQNGFEVIATAEFMALVVVDAHVALSACDWLASDVWMVKVLLVKVSLAKAEICK